MQYSLRASSIIEAMVVLLIIITGITGVYTLLNSSQKIALSTGNRIEAIQIARDGLEAFTNIRNTNQILFAADYENCWNVLNYNFNCIGNDGNDIAAESYRIYKNSSNQFELSASSENGGYSDSDYRSDFKVQKDSNGFYTQSGGLDFNPIYTREVQISYPSGNSNTDSIQVDVLVLWADSSSTRPQKVKMSTVLTNWKSKK